MPLNSGQLAILAKATKLTQPQIIACHHAVLFARLLEAPGNGSGYNKSDEELRRKLRLMVKRRLNQTHREAVGALPDKPSRQALLEQLWQEYESRLKVMAATVPRELNTAEDPVRGESGPV